jgi:Flp pilus assembly protein TadB
VSKERAQRRAAREHEAGLRAAARAAEQERRERRTARSRALRARTSDRLRTRPSGRQGGVLAQRRRRQNTALAAVLIFLNVVVWMSRPDWEARLGALVVTLLAFPVLRLLLFSRR